MVVQDVYIADPEWAARLKEDPSLIEQWRGLIEDGVLYPDSDGQPMAENTIQGNWIRLLVTELEQRFAAETAFIAADLFWYPVRGRPDICVAPDTMVAFGRPMGTRWSYKQWREGNVAPQVVFEVMSHNNRREEMDRKRDWYDRYGVEEYYVIHPDVHPGDDDEEPPPADWPTTLRVFHRTAAGLDEIPFDGEYISPRLGIRFVQDGNDLHLYFPDGTRLEGPTHKALRLIEERKALERELKASERARKKEAKAREARERELEAERLARANEQAAALAKEEQTRTKLRAAGLDPKDFGL